MERTLRLAVLATLLVLVVCAVALTWHVTHEHSSVTGCVPLQRHFGQC